MSLKIPSCSRPLIQLNVHVPMVLDCFQFVARHVGHSAVFGTAEVCAFHRAFVEAADVLVSDEIRGFTESHVAGAVGVVHEYINVGSESFEEVRRLARHAFRVHSFLIEDVSLVDLVGDGVLDPRRSGAFVTVESYILR